MFYQIALSVALLILAFTTLPKLSNSTGRPPAREQTVEPRQRPEPRPIKLEKQQTIEVRVAKSAAERPA